jgi:hypothetical protein
LTWAAGALVWDAWLRREMRRDLVDRLRPFRLDSVVEEVQSWPDDWR